MNNIVVVKRTFQLNQEIDRKLETLVYLKKAKSKTDIVKIALIKFFSQFDQKLFEEK